MGGNLIHLKPKIVNTPRPSGNVIPEVVPIFQSLYDWIRDLEISHYFRSDIKEDKREDYEEVIKMLKAIQNNKDWVALSTLNTSRRRLLEWKLNTDVQVSACVWGREYELRVSNGEDINRKLISSKEIGDGKIIEVYSIADESPKEGEFYFWFNNTRRGRYVGLETIRDKKFERLVKISCQSNIQSTSGVLNLSNLRNVLLDYVRFAPYNDYSSKHLSS